MKQPSIFWKPLAVVLSVFAAGQAAAADLSLQDAVNTALMNNRDLAAARHVVGQAHGRLRQAGLLPNPEVEFNGYGDFVSGSEGEGVFVIGLHQWFPLTSRLGLARQVARVDVAMALREVRNRERLLIAEVLKLYARAQAARRRERSSAQARSDSADLVSLAGERLAAGQGSLAESALARVDEQRWGNAANVAATEADKYLLEMKTALGLAADAPLSLSQSLESVVAELRDKTRSERLSSRPDMELAMLAADKSSAEVALSKAGAWEGVRLGIEYMQDRSVDQPGGISTGDFLGVKVTLPLPVWDRKEGATQERQAAAEAKAAQQRALELEVANSIAAARQQAALFDKQWARYRETTEPLVDSGSREISQGFSEGRVDARDLLMVRAQNASLRVESTSMLENLALALIDLEAAAGSHPAMSAPYLEEVPLHRKKKSKS
ncbi:MAG: TolC family protein [Chthoniobacterales bacterium]|jgi:outer membrane protein, heavy metal efflux system|nr:TolC family protein [Chthoniobacterales bacterium]